MDTTLEQLRYPIGRYERPATYDAGLLQEWMDVLCVLPSWMDACIENLDANQLQVPYRDGGWTIQQVVHHVADSHMNMYIRLKFALTEDTPTIMPYDENAWAVLPDVEQVPVNVSVTLLHALHRRIIAVLENLSATEWERTYYHPDNKRHFPIWEMTALYAWHSRHHMEHIRQLRERKGWSMAS
jgi:hypothetical protein